MPLPPNVTGGTVIAAAWGNQVVAALPQIGTIVMYAGEQLPLTPEWADWRICNGNPISRATYGTLWNNVCKRPDGSGRFGSGDGSSTFNLPDLKGRYPFGHNAGGAYGQVGVGQVFGSKDSSLPAHQHTGVNHLHGISLMSGAMDRTSTHSHWVRGVGTTSQAGGFGEGNVADIANTDFGPAFNTNDTDINHLHPINGATSGADRDLTTGITGADVTNANLPPSLALNFAIRVQ